MPDQAAIRAMYEAQRYVPELQSALLHPEVEWRTNWPGLAPAVYGFDGVREWTETFLDAWEAFELRVFEVLELDQNTVLVSMATRGRGKGSGVPVEMEIHDVLHFRDGRIALRTTWPDRASAMAAARAAEG